MAKPVTPLIHLEGVTKKYPVGLNDFYQALNGIDLTIFPGEFVAIMGPSGSGKSTLMHILGALDTATTGKQFFKGKDISSYSEDHLAQIRNKEIGFVFQFFNLLPRVTVFANVERPMLYAGIPGEERRKRVMAALSVVGIANKAQNPANHISGGQIQRVAIARSLIMEPSLILADEPTGNLDTTTSHEIMDILVALNREGHTIVIISHEEDIAAYAKRQIKIVDGRIVFDTFKLK
jgi:putative ABC transport system ATP-binding protein